MCQLGRVPGDQSPPGPRRQIPVTQIPCWWSVKPRRDPLVGGGVSQHLLQDSGVSPPCSPNLGGPLVLPDQHRLTPVTNHWGAEVFPSPRSINPF